MKEEPKLVSKKTWHVKRAVLIWLASFCLAVLGTMMIAGSEPDMRLPATICIVGVIGATSLLCLWLFVCWSLRCWRNRRRILIGLAVFATLIAVFYNVENWRGERAWEKCKRDLEAKGEVLDWNAYIPAPVPDEQNMLKAPRMQEWFVGRNSTNLPRYGWKFNTNAGSVVVARLTAVPPSTNSDPSTADAVLRFGDPAARAKAKKLIDGAVGPALSGSYHITLVAKPFAQIKPVHILVEADKLPTTNEVAQLFPDDVITSPSAFRNRAHLIEPSGGNSFNVSLNLSWFAPAADYLAQCDAIIPEINLIREAVKRPQIRIDGDYQRPFEMSVISFVAIRNLATDAAERARCCLLLGRSEQAFQELSLIFDMRRLLAAKPVMLVSAMINVAISGLCVDVIADGFRLQAWREPELIALQKQLQEINLPPAVADALRSERAAVCQTFQTIEADKIAEMLSGIGQKSGLWKKLANPVYLLLKFAPRGWRYQNLVTVATVQRATAIEGLSPKTQLIDPGKTGSAGREVETAQAHASAFNILARIAIPNFVRAIQTTALNQTKVNQALIVCGLERYRLAHGDYPESLDALVPEFVEKIPHDVIGGQPLKYRPTDDGKFLLYSIGWNEKDDGGQVVRKKDGTGDMVDGDWVWGVSMK